MRTLLESFHASGQRSGVPKCLRTLQRRAERDFCNWPIEKVVFGRGVFTACVKSWLETLHAASLVQAEPLCECPQPRTAPRDAACASLEVVFQELLELMTKTWNSQSDHSKLRSLEASRLRS